MIQFALSILISCALLCAPVWAQQVIVIRRAVASGLTAGDYNNSTSKMSSTTSVADGAATVTIFADVIFDDVGAGTDSVAAVSLAASSGDYVRLTRVTAGVRCTVNDEVFGSAAAVHAGTLSTATKYRIGCISETAALRYACHGGTCTSNNSNLVGPFAFDRTTIGVLTQAADSVFLDGKVREVCFWDTALTEANYASYHGGATCESLGADHIYRAASGTDLGDVGGVNLTPTDVTEVAW